ncbi:MAG: Mrp/NBP35 family ATP-binding protein [Nitrososphaerota archaeon]|jgi:ATP-binding protein involved in chromosome partitioning|nr:Mrp/NBP35 family ATP-binding protein [Nitrososphaerota archaeon]
MIDPRVNVIDKRLVNVKRIIAVSSGKGGVGKSLVATTLALTLKNEGYKVGLFDLDFTSPSTHIILNAQVTVLQEDKGILPPLVKEIKYMSLVYFVGENPAPLRGADVSNALIELLAVTQWGNLDFLIIDMPPGIGDIILDVLRLINRTEFLIVTTSSLLAFETVKKQVALLCELKARIIGIVENMKQTANNPKNSIEICSRKLGLRFLGEVLFDPTVETAIGDEAKLLITSVGQTLKHIVEKNL